MRRLSVLLLLVGFMTLTHSSGSLSDQVTDQLNELYCRHEFAPDKKLESFPHSKMILLLTDNDGYRLALESAAQHSLQLFVTMVHDIIDQEETKATKEFKDFWFWSPLKFFGGTVANAVANHYVSKTLESFRQKPETSSTSILLDTEEFKLENSISSKVSQKSKVQ